MVTKSAAIEWKRKSLKYWRLAPYFPAAYNQCDAFVSKSDTIWYLWLAAFTVAMTLICYCWGWNISGHSLEGKLEREDIYFAIM